MEGVVSLPSFHDCSCLLRFVFNYRTLRAPDKTQSLVFPFAKPRNGSDSQTAMCVCYGHETFVELCLPKKHDFLPFESLFLKFASLSDKKLKSFVPETVAQTTNSHKNSD